MVATALVIGGSGPTGPHIVEGMRQRGYKVSVLSRGVHVYPFPDDVERIREVIVATGALDETDELIGQLADQAKAAVEAANIEGEAKVALIELADLATKRNA